MRRHLVVALYNEDPSWILNVPNHWKVFIYCKSLKHYPKSILLKLYEKGHFIVLPNIGRETHTYFTHIYENYDKLADITIFTQGKHSDHVENLSEVLEQKTIDDIAKVMLRQHPANTPLTRPDIGYVALGHWGVYRPSTDFWEIITQRIIQKFWIRNYGSPEFIANAKQNWGNCFAATNKLLSKFNRNWYRESIEIHKKYRNTPWAMEIILAELFIDDNIYARKRICKLHL